MVWCSRRLYAPSGSSPKKELSGCTSAHFPGLDTRCYGCCLARREPSSNRAQANIASAVPARAQADMTGTEAVDDELGVPVTVNGVVEDWTEKELAGG